MEYIWPNYGGSGYTVIALATQFPSGPLGNQGAGIPYWGTGTGGLIVDYHQTSQVFWALALQYKPVAIMSFSRNTNDHDWVLEPGAYNYPQSSWLVTLNYTDLNNQPASQTWQPPYGGATASDYSPFHPPAYNPQKLSPPDPTQAANGTRATTLPRAVLSAAIQPSFNPTTQLRVTSPTNMASPGNFVSAYMAYHVSWYQAFSLTLTGVQCRAAGHTHVGIMISLANAQQAFDLQLNALIAWLG